MAKVTRTLSGASRDKYFRELFAAEPELPQAVAERLARTCTREIAQLRVREPIRDRSRAARAPVVVAPTKTAAPIEEQPVEPHQQQETAAPPPPAFDPYAFSLTVMLKRNGRKALLDRLEAIGSADDLHRLAEAQHVAVPAGLADLAQLRHAIVDGTAQRLADRRAAAS